MSIAANKAENALEKLVIELKQLPGVGEKTATRLAFFILRQPEDFALNMASAIVEARQKLHSCAQCCTFSEEPTCVICNNPQRSDEIICVVEAPSDIVAFEKSRQYHG